MSGQHHSRLLLLFSGILTAWGLLLFFQSAYFGALFYGVPVPFWAAWVGNLPIWSFNVLDTIMVVILIAAIVLSSREERQQRRSMRRSSRATGSGWIWTLVGLFLLAAFLAALGFNLAGLWTNFRHFVGF